MYWVLVKCKCGTHCRWGCRLVVVAVAVAAGEAVALVGPGRAVLPGTDPGVADAQSLAALVQVGAAVAHSAQAVAAGVEVAADPAQTLAPMADPVADPVAAVVAVAAVADTAVAAAVAGTAQPAADPARTLAAVAQADPGLAEAAVAGPGLALALAAMIDPGSAQAVQAGPARALPAVEARHALAVAAGPALGPRPACAAVPAQPPAAVQPAPAEWRSLAAVAESGFAMALAAATDEEPARALAAETQSDSAALTALADLGPEWVWPLSGSVVGLALVGLAPESFVRAAVAAAAARPAIAVGKLVVVAGVWAAWLAAVALLQVVVAFSYVPSASATFAG